jgi:hypothetical protein
MDLHVLGPAEKEIALRGRIIEALVNGNEQLRHRCAFLVSFIASKKDSYSLSELEMLDNMLGYAINDKVNGPPQSGYSFAEKGNGTSGFGSSFAETGKLSPELGYSFAENGNGTKQSGYSFTVKDKASPESGYTFAEKGKASPQFGYSISEKGNASPQSGIALPEKIDPAQLYISSIIGKVRAATGYKGKQSALDATARLFIHLYNGGGWGVSSA